MGGTFLKNVYINVFVSNSLTVHKLDSVCPELKDGKCILLNQQKTLVDWDEGGKECFMPQTVIKQKKRDEFFRYYSVNSSSNLVDESIYVYSDHLENFVEYGKGYSNISKFEILIDTNYDNLYIFAPKKVAEKFSRQIIKEKRASCTNISFNFSRILELEKLVVAWGMWEDSRGAITKTARFGKDVTTELNANEYKSITTMYIDYMFGTNPVQLILNAEGRIATQNNLKNSDLLNIYKDISGTLIQDIDPSNMKTYQMNKEEKYGLHNFC